MTFLILTEEGYKDLKGRLGKLPSPLWLNPGILTEEDIDRLRNDGTQVTMLTRPVNPHSSSEIEQAVRLIQEEGSAAVWVEYPARGLSPASTAAHAKGSLSAHSTRTPSTLNQAADTLYKRALHYIQRFAASDGPAMIIPYMSYGTPQQLRVQGRVLQNKGLGTPNENMNRWANVVEFYKQLGSDEVPGARLLVRYGDVTQEVVADTGGYFHADIKPTVQAEATGWQNVQLELLHPTPRNGVRRQATAQVLVPAASARFGVISDIDDTVLWSNVGNKLRMLTMLAVSNAHTRKPFKGVRAFYCALQQGASGNEFNPIFYVSSSPWHLYTSLVDFFKAQCIPLGPLVLKELGLKALFGSNRHHDHKLANIERILQTYPHLPFILIGDSGQHDPEIYKEVVQRHPKRILAIYIRNVNPDPARIEAIDRLIEEVKMTDTHLLLVPDSEFAAMHAAGEGYINADVLNAIRSDKRDDERLTNPKV